MKKLLGSALALALMFPYSQANAELLKNFKLSGDLSLQSNADRNLSDFVSRQSASAIGAQNQNPVGNNNPVIPGATAAQAPSYNDRLNDAQLRTMLNMDWDLLDDVHSKVTLRKNDRAFGSTGGTTQQNGSQVITAAGGSNLLGNVALDQAYFKVAKVFGVLDATVGRQYYGNPGDLVVYYGPQTSLYGQPTQAIDAVRADWTGDGMWVTGIQGRIFGNALNTLASAAGTVYNTDLTGLTAGYKIMDGLKVDANIYRKLTHANEALAEAQQQGTVVGALEGKNDDLWVYGAKAKYEAHGFSLGVEFQKNNGSNRLTEDAFGNSILGNAASGLPVVSAASVALGASMNNNSNGLPNPALPAQLSGDQTGATLAAINLLGAGATCAGIAGAAAAGSKLSKLVAVPNNPGLCYFNGIPVVSNALGNNAAAYEGFAWKFDASYKADLEGIASFTPWLGLAWGQGRGSTQENKNEGFHSINSDYRPGDIYGRFAASGLMTLGSGIPCLPGTEGCTTAAGNVSGVFATGISNGYNNALNNRVIWSAGLKATPSALNQLTAGVSWYGFWLSHVTNTGNPVQTNGLQIVQNINVADNSKNLGNEIDFDFAWKHSENVAFTAGVAGFYAGTYVKNLIKDQVRSVLSASGTGTVNTGGTAVSNNPAILAYGDVHVKF